MRTKHFGKVLNADMARRRSVWREQVRTNWVGLIDEWATRFFHELDYEREAQNGMTFKEQMAGLDGIVVADVYQEFSNKTVLTTVWVQGMSKAHVSICLRPTVQDLVAHSAQKIKVAKDSDRTVSLGKLCNWPPLLQVDQANWCQQAAIWA